MSILQTFPIAVRTIRRNAMRSFLTALGIIIGVAAVIALVAIGEGAQSMIEESFKSMGSNMLVVLPGSSRAGGARGGFGSMPTVTWDDLRAIRTEASAVKYASVEMRTSAQMVNEELNWTTSVTGVSPEFFLIRNWILSKGELFTQADVDTARKVAVVGQTVVDKMFGENADPVGQMVRIKNIPFLVIGVLEKKGQSAMGQDADDTAVMPYTTFQTKILSGGLQQFINGAVLLSAVSEDDIERAEAQVTELLRDRHHIPEGKDDDFSVRNLTELANAMQSGTQTLTLLLASIAAVSLLVGGIGIMNIMLVSVTERTREIGLRMAVGARPRNILAQFLVEALTLSIAGGLIGTILGLFAAQRLAASFDWPFRINPGIMLLAVGFSALVGVVFGIYPARKASRLDPIEALRYE